MKKIFAILFLTLSTANLNAQVREIMINIRGGYDLIVEVGQGKFVVVSDHGYLVDADIPGRTEFYDNFWSYRAGKIKRIGNTDFDYYSDFWSYNAGKVKKIGNVSFEYHSDFWPYESGKLKVAGNVRIEYHNSFYPEREGKVKKIGGIDFGYYTRMNLRAPDDFNGLLESVGPYTYGYDFYSGRAGRSRNNGRGSQRTGKNSHGNDGDRGGYDRSRPRSNPGPVILGQKNVNIGGIEVTIVN